MLGTNHKVEGEDDGELALVPVQPQQVLGAVLAQGRALHARRLRIAHLRREYRVGHLVVQ